MPQTAPHKHSLAVIIPVWNDAEGVARLLPYLWTLPGLSQVILYDDASRIPLSPESLGMPELAEDPRIIWMRANIQGGAGRARNQAFERVTAAWTLFLDSDDLPLPDLGTLLEDLAQSPEQDFDFCLFSHVEDRQRAVGRPGPLDSDQRHWKLVPLGPKPTRLTGPQAARLVRISAYPWNKIYRSGFLRETGIRCTEIPVHNDIELHWRSFLQARRILGSTHAGVEHFVHEGGKRLTNRTGAERFEVFPALVALHQDLTHLPGKASLYAAAVADFYLGLFHWIEAMLHNSTQRRAFRWRAQRHLRDHLSVPQFTLIATTEPRLAQRLNFYLTDLPA